MDIKKELFALQDNSYRDFHAKLVPDLDKDKIIGVRVPKLRILAKEAASEAERFLNDLPHEYYEENTLHAFLVSNIRDFDECIKRLNEFLPYVDNWATCDGIRPKCFKKNKEKLLLHIERWIKSGHTYTVRFAIEILMTYFLDEDFDKKYLDMVSSVVSDEYYINMMIAWYFATALAKQWEKAVGYIEKGCLSPWVNNKTIQKAAESYRIPEHRKEYLKKFKITVR